MLYSHHQSLLSEVCTQVKPCDHILCFLNVDNSLAGDYPGWSVLRVHKGHSVPAPSIFTTNVFHSLAVGAGKPLLSYNCHSPNSLPHFPVDVCWLLWASPALRFINAPLLPSAFFRTDINATQIFVHGEVGWGAILSPVFFSPMCSWVLG